MSLRAAVSSCLADSHALSQLDTHARCAICYDYYTHPVALGCLHAFCSICIRRSIYYHPFCPICHLPTNVNEIRTHFHLGAWCREVKLLRMKLEQELFKTIDRFDIEDEEDGEEGEIEEKVDHSVIPIVSSSSAIAASSSSSSSTAAASSSSSSSLKVECPICQLSIIETRINQHLDKCLGKEENRQKSKGTNTNAGAPPSFSTTTLTPSSTDATNSHALPSTTHASATASASRLPFPAYNMLSDKSLKKLLIQVGFPSTTSSLSQDRDSLIRRHREFIFRHNAETDAIEGERTYTDANIIKEIIRKERIVTSTTMSKSAKQSLLLEAFNAQESNATSNGNHTSIATLASTPYTSSSHAIKPLRKRSNGELGSSDAPASPRKRTHTAKSSTPEEPNERVELKEARRDQSIAIDEDESGPPPPPILLDTPSPPPAASSDVTPAPAASSTPAPSSTVAPASSASASVSPDPFAQLIAQYESIHGPRKRWRRKWGVDLSLYKGNPPPAPAKHNTHESNHQHQPNSSTAPSSSSSSSSSSLVDDVSIDTVRTNRAAASKPAKPVFALFQTHVPAPATTNEKETSTASLTVPPPISSSSVVGSVSSKSSGGVLRVSTAVCTSCRNVCRGSFPLGASIVCPRCRPNWTELHHAHSRRTTSNSTSTMQQPTSGKPTWQQLAQQQQQQQAALPANATTSTPSPPLPSPSSMLSVEQKQVIEARRIAAIEKLKAAKQANTEHTPETIED